MLLEYLSDDRSPNRSLYAHLNGMDAYKVYFREGQRQQELNLQELCPGGPYYLKS